MLRISPPNLMPRLASPSVPCVAYRPMLAKYVNEFNHSTRTPLVITSASTPGVINVTLWNNIDASLLDDVARLPSTLAPPPASPLANPLGSLIDVVVPLVITVMFCTYGLRLETVNPGANANA